METLVRLLGIWMLVEGFVLLFRMGRDKSLAVRHERRIPERVLFRTALLGGAWGGLLGMLFFRHKTQHREFVFGFSILTAVQCLLLAALAFWAIG